MTLMYNYENCRKRLFTEEMLNKFIWFRDQVNSFLDTSGAVTQCKAVSGIKLPDTDMENAFMDRLVELGELQEVTTFLNIKTCNRVFIRSSEKIEREQARQEQYLFSQVTNEEKD